MDDRVPKLVSFRVLVSGMGSASGFGSVTLLLFVFISRYEGIAGLIPSTNNGIESINGKIKQYWIGRRVEPVGDFLPKAVEMVRHSSWRSEELGFADIPEISKPLWKLANELGQSGAYTMVPLPVAEGQLRRFVVSRRHEHVLSPQEFVQLMDNPELTNWPDFTQVLRRDWHVVTMLEADWATCSCGDGLKEYRCRHSVAVEIAIGKVEVPENVLALPGGVPRKRGRPKKVMGGYGQ